MRDKSRERQVRRLARECGLKLVRAGAWNRWAPYYGTYAIIDPVRNTLELADPENGYGMSLDEIEHFLARFLTHLAEGESRSAR